MTPVSRPVVGTALAAVAGAAVAWTVKSLLDDRRRSTRRIAHREELSRWENEGGSPVAVGQERVIARAREPHP